MRGSKQDATEDIQAYLGEDTFCKYLYDVDQPYLIGIGIDGLPWTMWMKDLEIVKTREPAPLCPHPAIPKRTY